MTNKFKHTPEEARKLWVDALRSGEYAQTTGSLRREDGFCCLGIACDVFRTHEADAWWHTTSIGAFVCRGISEAGYTHHVVKDWLGMETSAGVYGDGMSRLSADNDNGKTFLEIADIIESNPPGLFMESGT